MTYEKVIDLIADELNYVKDDLSLTTHLQNDLGVDSLDAVELIMAMEDAFDITIPDEVIQNLHTIADIVKYLEERETE